MSVYDPSVNRQIWGNKFRLIPVEIEEVSSVSVVSSQITPSPDCLIFYKPQDVPQNGFSWHLKMKKIRKYAVQKDNVQ